jgi:hypothetical protein
MAAELDDLFASPEDCGLSRSSLCSRTRTGSENRTTTWQQPTLLPSPCDRVAAKRGLFLGHAIREFVAWYCSEPRLAFNRTAVLRHRIYLERRQYAPATINLRPAAVRRVATTQDRSVNTDSWCLWPLSVA